MTEMDRERLILSVFFLFLDVNEIADWADEVKTWRGHFCFCAIFAILELLYKEKSTVLLWYSILTIRAILNINVISITFILLLVNYNSIKNVFQMLHLMFLNNHFYVFPLIWKLTAVLYLLTPEHDICKDQGVKKKSKQKRHCIWINGFCCASENKGVPKYLAFLR